MSRTEKFIQDCTKNCSNEIAHWDIDGENIKPIYSPWLTPDQAKNAVGIAREEMIEKGIEFLKDHLEGYDIFDSDIERSVESFKLAMKYE